MTHTPARVTPHWLSLREPADARARSAELAAEVARHLEDAPHPLVIHDLGSGTGSMSRWLAPRLPGPQHWVLHDRDPDLLDVAAAQPPPRDADGVEISVETRQDDITRLGREDLRPASLITASALLDLLGIDELERLVRSCVQAECPALLTLSVTGRVRLTPPDAMDSVIRHAFNEHQRRTTEGRTLLGPVAGRAAVHLFRMTGWHVEVRASPWQLDRGSRELIAEWLTGWVAAACEQRHDLCPAASECLARRRADLARGRLSVAVQHVDLLARPHRSGR